MKADGRCDRCGVYYANGHEVELPELPGRVYHKHCAPIQEAEHRLRTYPAGSHPQGASATAHVLHTTVQSLRSVLADREERVRRAMQAYETATFPAIASPRSPSVAALRDAFIGTRPKENAQLGWDPETT